MTSSVHSISTDTITAYSQINEDMLGQFSAVKYDYDDVIIRIGETLRSCKGAVGTVRFFGPTNFAEGEWIGLELHNRLGNHNGTISTAPYFTCPSKRGIFIDINKIGIKQGLVYHHDQFIPG